MVSQFRSSTLSSTNHQPVPPEIFFDIKEKSPAEVISVSLALEAGSLREGPVWAGPIILLSTWLRWLLILCWRMGETVRNFVFRWLTAESLEFWKVLSVSKISPEPLRSHQMFSICMFSLSLFWPCQCRRASKNHNTQNTGFFWLIFNYLALRAKITVFPETPHKCQVLKREYVVNIWGWCRVFRMLNNRIKHNAA